MSDATYQTKIYEKQGGEEIVVASGGTITVESGGTINVKSGAAFQNDGTPMDLSAGIATSTTSSTAELNILTGCTATAAELNMAADSSANTELVTTTNVITAAESGKTFFLNSATEFVSTLPAPAVGLRYSFIVKAAPASASYTIVTDSGDNIIVGQQHSAAGDAGDTGTTDDTITFVDGQAVAGDRVDVISDGTLWYAYAYSKVAAGITFTTAG